MQRFMPLFVFTVLLTVLVVPTAPAEENSSLEPAFEIFMEIGAAPGSATTATREALTISSEGTSGARPPRLLHGSAPFYPERGRLARIQGSTTVGGIIDRQGVVRNIVALKPFPKGLGGMFDEAAKGALSRWRFEPGTLDGEPVAVAIEVKVQFRFVPRHHRR